MSAFEQKQKEKYLDGLVILYHVVNSEGNLDKASNIIHDLLLGYDVVKDYPNEFEKGFKDVKENYLDSPLRE